MTDTHQNNETSEKIIEDPNRPAFDFTHLLNEILRQQGEILYTAEYVESHRGNIDNAKERTRATAGLEFPHVDAGVFDAVWGYISREEELAEETDTGREDEGAEGTGNTKEDARNRELARVYRQIPEDCRREYFSLVLAGHFRPAQGGPRMLSMLLTNLIGDFEVLLSNLMRILFRLRPGLITSPDKGYPYTDIVRFESMSAFKRHVTEKAIDNTLYDGYKEWLDTMSKKFSIRIPDMAVNDFILEAFQRRHIVVHNGGRVSRQYIEKVPEKYKDVAVGAFRPIDIAYLRQVADHLLVVGISLVCASALKHLDDKEHKRIVEAAASNMLYKLLQVRRYEPVREVTAIYTSKTFVDAYAGYIWDVNGWLARKFLGEFHTCRQQVEQWDTGPLTATFKLARLALLDMNEEALEVARPLRGTKELSEWFWTSWPLLDGVRALEVERSLKEESSSYGDSGDEGATLNESEANNEERICAAPITSVEGP